MFGKLQGRVDFIGQNFIILMTNGIGFKIMLPSNILLVVKPGDSRTFWIETIVRDNSIGLIGFEEWADQELFMKLTGVSGIGPKVALTMLGTYKAAVLESAIADGDVKTLTAVPGVGKKVAERVVMELKGKVSAAICGAEKGGASMDALSALEALGYRRADVAEIIQKLSAENPSDSVQSLITKALRKIDK